MPTPEALCLKKGEELLAQGTENKDFKLLRQSTYYLFLAGAPEKASDAYRMSVTLADVSNVASDTRDRAKELEISIVLKNNGQRVIKGLRALPQSLIEDLLKFKRLSEGYAPIQEIVEVYDSIVERLAPIFHATAQLPMRHEHIHTLADYLLQFPEALSAARALYDNLGTSS